MRGWRSIVALLAAVLLICGTPLAAACAAACDTEQMQMSSCPPESNRAAVMASMECDHCHGKAQRDEVSASCSTMHGKTATALQANGDEETAHAPAALHAVAVAAVFLEPPVTSVQIVRIEPPGAFSPPRLSLTPLRI
ncbi:MAG TPA: hypothetical protein VGC07_04325 [Granulicella sp.]